MKHIPPILACLLGLAAGTAATTVRATISNPANVFSTTADGAWAYSVLTPAGPANPTNYVPTLGDIQGATFVRHYVPDPVTSALTGGDAWTGSAANDEATYHIFKTYLQVDNDVTIDFGVAGDDGHALFVDGELVGGGGVGTTPHRIVTFTPGAPHEVILAGYNSGGPWSFASGQFRLVPPDNLPPPNNPQFERRLQEFPGVRINGRGYFTPAVGPTQVSNLNEPDDTVPFNQRIGSSFTTDDFAYTLNSAALRLTAPGGDPQLRSIDLRVHKDLNGVPGEVLGALGSFSGNVGNSEEFLATFQSSGMTLAPHTKYWLTVHELQRSTSVMWNGTLSTGQTSSNGWTIGDSSVDGISGSWEVASFGPRAFSVSATRTTPIDLGVITPPSIGHSFVAGSQVTDFLVDQTQSHGGGAAATAKIVDLASSNQLKLTIAAPEGTRFLVDVPAGKTATLLSFFAWTAGPSPELGAQLGADAVFAGVDGSAPAVHSQFSVVGSDNRFFVINASSNDVTSDFSFTSITYTVAYEHRNGTGPATYQVDNAQMFASYATTATEDPGRFVRIIHFADFDEDGDVDGDDLGFWRGNMGLAFGATHKQGDADGDRDVDGDDLLIWQRQLGRGPVNGGATAVPEPPAATMLALVGFGMVALRRKRRCSWSCYSERRIDDDLPSF